MTKTKSILLVLSFLCLESLQAGPDETASSIKRKLETLRQKVSDYRSGAPTPVEGLQTRQKHFQAAVKDVTAELDRFWTHPAGYPDGAIIDLKHELNQILIMARRTTGRRQRAGGYWFSENVPLLSSREVMELMYLFSLPDSYLKAGIRLALDYYPNVDPQVELSLVKNSHMARAALAYLLQGHGHGEKFLLAPLTVVENFFQAKVAIELALSGFDGKYPFRGLSNITTEYQAMVALALIKHGYRGDDIFDHLDLIKDWKQVKAVISLIERGEPSPVIKGVAATSFCYTERLAE